MVRIKELQRRLDQNLGRTGPQYDCELNQDGVANYIRSGADLGFSRRGGGADFQKIVQNFDDLFFRSTKLIFRALPKHCFARTLAKFSAPQANFWKNSQKSRFWALFEKFWQKNRVFFGARSPSKLVYIGAKGALRKTLGSVGQKWSSEKVSKGGPFGSAGGRIPEGGGGRGFVRLPAPP